MEPMREIPSMYHKIDFEYKNPSLERQRFNIGYWIPQTKETGNVGNK